jgi:hypothetical protein
MKFLFMNLRKKALVFGAVIISRQFIKLKFPDARKKIAGEMSFRIVVVRSPLCTYAKEAIVVIYLKWWR